MIKSKWNIEEVVKELEGLNDEDKYELHKFDQFEFYSNNLTDKTFRLIDCYCHDDFDDIEAVKGDCANFENGLYACKRCFLENLKSLKQ